MTARAGWLALVLVAFPTVASAAADGDPAPPSGVPESDADEAVLEPGIGKMIEIAIEGGNEAVIAHVFAIARKAAPEARDEIDAREQVWKAKLAVRNYQRQEEQLAKLREAGLLDNWKGELEVGASRSTGSTSSLGLLGSLELKREGLEWTHKISARAEVQSTNDDTSAERIFAAWQPNYRFEGDTYAYGLAQYEHDPFAGYDERYTLGGGLGYRALDSERLKLELEGGPALRHVNEVDGTDRSKIAARGSLNLNWKITPTLGLTQTTAVYLEGGDGNVVANTALDTKLIGNLKARFSYNVQYERNPPIGTAALNTQSRATFIYGF